MAQYREELPKTIKVHCTDKDQTLEADLFGYQREKFIDVVLNTVRVKLVFNGRLYVGSMAGLEFTARDPDVIVIKDGR